MLGTAVWYALTFAGGVALFAAPLTRTGRVERRWTHIALWISGAAAVGWSSLGFALLLRSGSLSEGTYDLFVHFKTLFAGMAIAMLVLLFASGEFAKFLPGSARNGR